MNSRIPCLALVACVGCSLNTPSGPLVPPTVLPGLAMVSTAQGFKPMGFGFDSIGNLVVAQPDAPQVNVVSSETLDLIETDPVPAETTRWAPPVSSTGYAGALFFKAGDGSIYLFDISGHTSQLYLTTSGLRVFQARRDVPGVVWGDTLGNVHFDDPSAVETLAIPVGKGLQIESIASGGDGRTFVYVSADSRCNAVIAYDASGKRTATLPAALGASPCLAALTMDNQVIMLSASSAQGTQVQAFQGGSLAPASQPFTVTGMAAQKLLFSADGSRIALLGGPSPFGTSVAVAMTPDLFTNTPRGNQGPFRTISSTSIPSADDGIFDDSNVLWVGDAKSQNLDLLE